MSEPEIQLSEAEKRLLRRSFHRYALPYLGALGLALAVAMALPGTVEVEPGSDPATTAAMEANRTALDELRIELASLRGKVSGVESEGSSGAQDLAKSFAAVDKRIKRVAGKVEALESRADQAESAGTSAAALPDDAASWDVSAILERLYDLEVRQEKVEQGGSSDPQSDGWKEIIARLERLETRP